jgi:hypothetical protein
VGYPELEEEPRTEATGASYEICPSCGIQFGYRDEAGGDADAREAIYRHWRTKWIETGMVWDKGRTKPPRDWDPMDQLRNVEKTG